MEIILVLIIVVLLCYSIGITLIANYAWNSNKQKCRILEEENDLFMYWIQKKMDGQVIKEYLYKNKIETIAFYKFTPICEILCEELCPYVEIAYCLDENADKINEGIEGVPLLKPGEIERGKNVDMLIIATSIEDERLMKKARMLKNINTIKWACEIIKEF